MSGCVSRITSVLFSAPGEMGSLLAGGIGGGTIAVPLFGITGGYALLGRGPVWGRVVSGVIALAPIPAWALTVTSFGGPGLAVTTPRGAWVALFFWSFLAVLALGCAIPHQRPWRRTTSGRTSPRERQPNMSWTDPAAPTGVRLGA
jgi:hypothetical protein